MGATGGVEPSEEERKGKALEGPTSSLPDKFVKMFSALNQESSRTNQDLHPDVLQDILNHPSAPDMNDQIIHEGFLQAPDLAPTHVVLLAEAIPSWLPVIDGWRTERLFMHCEREELWFSDNLKLTTPITTFPTVAGLARAEWRVQVNKVIIVQGSASFCRKMVEGLSKL